MHHVSSSGTEGPTTSTCKERGSIASASCIGLQLYRQLVALSSNWDYSRVRARKKKPRNEPKPVGVTRQSAAGRDSASGTTSRTSGGHGVGSSEAVDVEEDPSRRDGAHPNWRTARRTWIANYRARSWVWANAVQLEQGRLMAGGFG